MVKTILALARRALRQRWRLAVFIFSSLLYAGADGAVIYFARASIALLDTRKPPAWVPWRDRPDAAWLCFLTILALSAVVLVVKCGTQYIRRYLQGWLTQRIVVDVQSDLAAHLLTLDLGFFQRERAGDLLTRTTNDISMLANSLKLLCIAVSRPLSLGVAVGMTFWLNWRLALLGLILAPAGLGAITWLSLKMRRASKNALERRSNLTSVLVQFVSGMRTVKAFGCEAFECAQFQRENRQFFNQLMKYERARALSRPVVELMSGIGGIAVMYMGGKWAFAGELSLADLAGFLTALAIIYNPGKEMTKADNELQAMLPGAERVFALFEHQPEVKSGKIRPSEFRESLRLEKVSFAYRPDQPVLCAVDLELRRGECVALVGPSGGGKSTLIDLLLRFYDPDAGRILLDGVDLRECDPLALRRLIALVPQDTFLFSGSIRDNIAYGQPGSDQNLIEAAARAANIHDEILALPDGYDTEVGERGAGLSGGQRQRVAIARAIFKNTPLLILDEATSALDAESERQVTGIFRRDDPANVADGRNPAAGTDESTVEAIDHLLAGRTCLVIAHRLSTVRHADRIALLEDGRITATGHHEELMLASPTYAHLVRLQMLHDRPRSEPS